MSHAPETFGSGADGCGWATGVEGSPQAPLKPIDGAGIGGAGGVTVAGLSQAPETLGSLGM